MADINHQNVTALKILTSDKNKRQGDKQRINHETFVLQLPDHTRLHVTADTRDEGRPRTRRVTWSGSQEVTEAGCCRDKKLLMMQLSFWHRFLPRGRLLRSGLVVTRCELRVAHTSFIYSSFVYNPQPTVYKCLTCR